MRSRRSARACSAPQSEFARYCQQSRPAERSDVLGAKQLHSIAPAAPDQQVGGLKVDHALRAKGVAEKKMKEPPQMSHIPQTDPFQLLERENALFFYFVAFDFGFYPV